jgi:NTE family protein
MLQALADHGVHPDVLVGTSAGAVNAAFVAGHGTAPAALGELERLWCGLRRSRLFPLSPPRAAAALAGAVSSLCSSRGLRQLLEQHLAFTDLQDARTPLHLVATDVRSGEEVLLSRGPAADAVLASAAIPAIYPSVRVGERDLVDGGIADNAAISHAVALGADTVYVLPSGYACALEHAPRTALGSGLHALTLLIQRRLVLEVAHYSPLVDLRVVPPLCPVAVSSADFGHARALIDRAYASTSDWLDRDGGSRPDPSRYVSLHTHSPAESTPGARHDRPRAATARGTDRRTGPGPERGRDRRT